MKRLNVLIICIYLIFSFSQAGYAQLAGMEGYGEQSPGFVLGANISGDLSAISKVNTESGFGFGLDLVGAYYFNPYVGIYAGLGYFSRPLELNEEDKIGWLDIPVGFAFRWLSGMVEHTGGIGIYFSNPMDDFEDPGFAGGEAKLQNLMGIHIMGGTYFPITEALKMGLNVQTKISFSSPFEDEDFDKARMVSFDFGLGARYAL